MAGEQPYVPPRLNAPGYCCPSCRAYAAQVWTTAIKYNNKIGRHPLNEVQFAQCAHCNRHTIWHDGKLIYPETTAIVPPNPDMDDDIKSAYLEAAGIVNKSPRAAAALLRLCLQKLCKQLGEAGRNINDDIASLVRKGLSPQIQQALDVLRVTGNNAVHPGQIDLTDNTELATDLFELINLIAESTISQPKKVQAMFDALPQPAKDAVRRRDSP